MLVIRVDLAPSSTGLFVLPQKFTSASMAVDLVFDCLSAFIAIGYFTIWFTVGVYWVLDFGGRPRGRTRRFETIRSFLTHARSLRSRKVFSYLKHTPDSSHPPKLQPDHYPPRDRHPCGQRLGFF